MSSLWVAPVVARNVESVAQRIEPNSPAVVIWSARDTGAGIDDGRDLLGLRVELLVRRGGAERSGQEQIDQRLVVELARSRNLH